MLEVLKGFMAIETKAYNMYLLTICWLIPSAVVVEPQLRLHTRDTRWLIF